MCIILTNLIGCLFITPGTFGSVGFDTTVYDTTGGGEGWVVKGAAIVVGCVAGISCRVVGVIVAVKGGIRI